MTTSSTPSNNRLRNIIAVTCVASLSFAVIHNVSNGYAVTSVNTKTADAGSEAYTYGKFHQSGLGGVYNIAHPAGAKARRKLSQTPVIVPRSPTPGAIQSISRDNIENLWGHYVHDEHRSPFASFLYARPKEELEAEQQEYVEKMNKIREEWGAWDFKDATNEIRPLADFSTTPHKDLQNSDLPENSWQKDPKYVSDLIAEGKKLVARVKEGIYAEYGWATKDMDEAKMEERAKLFEVHISEITDPRPNVGVLWINQKGFDMLVRKLLHAMIANDEFYLVLGGHSAAAGHGNHFHQQYTMQFANIMETVFHKLGMRLIAKNMAMGGLGTTHFSFGQSTLYGEKDVLMWDSGMTENSLPDEEFYHKQGLLGGERVPIIFGSKPSDLETATDGNFWYGGEVGGVGLNSMGFVPLTTGIDQVETLPYAARYMKCDATVGAMCGSRGMDKFHASCWEPRSDVNATVKQRPQPSGQASWHGGDRWHQIVSRKHILLFLKAFEKAFEVWEKGIEDDGFPLKETYWHVGGHYTNVRDKLTSYLNREDIINTTACEKRFGTIGLEKVCRVKMSGMTEWGPVNNGQENDILSRVKPASNGYKPHRLYKPVYEGVDIIPTKLKLPRDQIDLHAIALVTTYSPAELDQSWVDDDDEDAEEAENSRRMLRKAAGVDRNLSEEKDIVETVNLENERERFTGADDEVVPGIGWGHEDAGGASQTGYCDGSATSTCIRGNKTDCFLYGHNDNRQCLSGNALSGWIVITVPELTEGLIVAKLEWWHPRGETLTQTRGWTEVNDGKILGDGGSRQLKAAPVPWPDDIKLDIAVNGKIHKTLNKEEFFKMASEIAYNEAYYKLVDDASVATGEPVELGIRIRSTEDPKKASFGITHIYWA
eukprot:CAMPEP_0197243762 /NCGR_PEP_ID=MMETSP1429-20130617/9101_1 /TAXON_ID=49237 /ORGANISM="Chaetoceros  sp., Strain UNC1202" /LENGTH=881 /DNA_ID=CAMNT_0042704027 /DNA_START=58 /DNA_END=2703 /DNA_ORIENTATION=-